MSGEFLKTSIELVMVKSRLKGDMSYIYICICLIEDCSFISDNKHVSSTYDMVGNVRVSCKIVLSLESIKRGGGGEKGEEELLY